MTAWLALCAVLSSAADDAATKAQQLKEQGQYAEAEAAARAGLERLKPHEAVARVNLLNELGDAQLFQGQYADAKKTLTDALAAAEKLPKGELVLRARQLHNLGTANDYLGDLPAALEYLERAAAVRKVALGDKHWAVAETLDGIANIHFKAGKLELADKRGREALAIYRVSDKPVDLGISLMNLSETCRARGANAEADALLGEALVVLEKAVGKQHPTYLNALNNLAVSEMKQGQFASGVARCDEVLAAQVKVLGANHPDAQRTRASCEAGREQLKKQKQEKRLKP